MPSKAYEEFKTLMTGYDDALTNKTSQNENFMPYNKGNANNQKQQTLAPYIRCMHLLIKNNANLIHEKDRNEETLFDHAYKMGNYVITTVFLTRYEYKINNLDKNNKTMLDKIINNEQKEDKVLNKEWLIKNGAKTSAELLSESNKNLTLVNASEIKKAPTKQI